MSVYGFDEIHNKHAVIAEKDFIIVEDSHGVAAQSEEYISMSFSSLGIPEGANVIPLSVMQQNQSLTQYMTSVSFNGNTYPGLNVTDKAIRILLCNKGSEKVKIGYKILLYVIPQLIDSPEMNI